MAKQYINKMEELGLIKDGGFMLDLGCGAGADSDYFKSKGYTVASVDINSDYPNAHKSDICDFEIEPNKYDIIICNNVLPFIADKNKVKEIMHTIVSGLTNNGCAFLSLFGPEDDWHTRKNMSFFSFSEAREYLGSLGIFFIEESNTKGYGTAMKGGIKYWDIHRFLISKETRWKRS